MLDLKKKRKAKASVQPARKKVKTQHLSANDLPWKTVKRTQEAGIDAGLEGIMELEEVEGVEVVYEETEKGKVAKFNVSTHSRVIFVLCPKDLVDACERR